jgi:hypothetical protein
MAGLDDYLNYDQLKRLRSVLFSKYPTEGIILPGNKYFKVTGVVTALGQQANGSGDRLCREGTLAPLEFLGHPSSPVAIVKDPRDASIIAAGLRPAALPKMIICPEQ